MKKLAIASLALLVLSPMALLAQGTGGLPAQVRQQLQSAMTDLQNKDVLTTEASLAESVGKEKLDAFLAGAVVKLALHPDGNFECHTLAGGELEGLRLGKQKLALTSDEEEAWATEEEWTRWSGTFQQAKRPQPLSLTLKAGAREVTVDCQNKYRKTDKSVTYYVGPLDGLFCMGLTDSEADEKGG